MLLDEPTTALDICYREEIRQWMRTYQQRGGIIVMTTHEESEIMEAQHCLVMNGGKLFETADDERDMRHILDMTREELENE